MAGDTEGVGGRIQGKLCTAGDKAGEIARANPETSLFFPTDDSEDARERATDMNLFMSTFIEATRALSERRDADAGAYLASSGHYLNRGYPLAERDS
jgi:hypothetical protein